MVMQTMIETMSGNAVRVAALATGVGDAKARWKPSADDWSILEVMAHLYDEEREDFRVRLDIILHRPDDAWPPIDPGGWVTARRYNEKDLSAVVDGYLREREGSVAWLEGLANPDWEAEVMAPWGGAICAGDMLAAWVAHDLLHMRQLVELHHAYLLWQAAPYSTRYAGEW
jgi:hypothetical protein